ncbi:MAG: hypothetical protein R2688_09905 [Fimbriimonadaceae bacterium]
MASSDETRKHIHHERRQVLLFRGAVVGVAAGIVAVLFQLLVRVTETGVAGLRDNLGVAKWVVMPLVGALLGGGAAELTKSLLRKPLALESPTSKPH